MNTKSIEYNSWTVTGEHVDMAKDILYDLTRNLILWLEDEVEVGFKKTEVTEYRQKFTLSFQNTGKVDFDDSRGEGWVRKERMLKTYEDQAKVTRGTAWNHFNKYAKDMFETTKESRIVYLRLKQMD